jgi:hypothetical protein
MGYLRRVTRLPRRWPLVLLVMLPACTVREGPPPLASQDLVEVPAPSVPLEVRDFEVVQADGTRGVLIKLSRLPDGVRHHAENAPARIVLEVKGPTRDEAPEEAFPSEDALVSSLRVSRQLGTLRVTLDLRGETAPAYSVHPMADWILIRLATPGADWSEAGS